MNIQSVPDANRRDLSSLVADPRESLGIEIKSWIGTDADEHRAKIVRAIIALRNNDGGVLLVGFKDDGTPDVGNEPSDVRAVFHPDIIQALIGKYVSSPFEVRVEFIARDEVEYPAIIVPSGLTAPVACKADLPHDSRLLKANTVYVRTLGANRTVSSSAALWSDWGDLAARCFANREADIARFVRRHLVGLDPTALANSLESLRDAFAMKPAAIRAAEMLNDARNAFNRQCEKRQTRIPSPIGYSEIGIVCDGKSPGNTPDPQLLWQLKASAPSYSGWPPWLIFQRGFDDPSAPYVFEGAWEALLNEELFGHSLEFWRINPNGEFYYLAANWEDMREGSQTTRKPNTILDYYLQTYQTTERLAAALSFTKTLGFDLEATTLAVACRWTNLNGRILTCDSDRGRWHTAPARAQQNDITTECQLPAETTPTALTAFVERLVAPLFALFGEKFDTRVIDEIVQKTVSRR